MSDDKMQYPERASDVGALMGWLKDFFGHFRLSWELLWDKRVPFIAKLVPILTLLYILSPIDLIPDVVLGLGQLDDLAIFLIGMRLFVDVCPPALVSEHQTEAQLELAATPAPAGNHIIDVEARVITDDDAEKQPQAPIGHVW